MPAVSHKPTEAFLFVLFRIIVANATDFVLYKSLLEELSQLHCLLLPNRPPPAHLRIFANFRKVPREGAPFKSLFECQCLDCHIYHKGPLSYAGQIPRGY